jgi:hypothetical protein
MKKLRRDKREKGDSLVEDKKAHFNFTEMYRLLKPISLERMSLKLTDSDFMHRRAHKIISF